ncbi:MAG: citrate synthase [Pirellulaceae bacterium]
MSDTAKLTLGEQELELPIIVGSEQERGLDISKLRGATGAITLDEGFVNTGSTQSGITFLNGEQGILRYCGYAIEDIAEKCDFIDTCYLLLHGELPTEQQRDSFRSGIIAEMAIPSGVQDLIRSFPTSAHPMAIISAAIQALSTHRSDKMDPLDADQVASATQGLIAALPTIAAYSHRHTAGQNFIAPNPELGYVENFLTMMFGDENGEYEIDQDFVDAMNLLLIVHADHEQNCSTSTVRMIGSANSNLYASIVGGICALWGPLHGGANEACVKMLQMIADDNNDVAKYVAKAQDKDDNFRLMGFGHRVYKNYDPRAKIIKKACDVLLEKLDLDDPLFEIAQSLEKVALEDSYFVDRKLYPNVDFYSGVIYRAIGIPVEMFTVLFSLGRLPGWLAHWQEMHASPGKRICRPRQVYTGPTAREIQ